MKRIVRLLSAGTISGMILLFSCSKNYKSDPCGPFDNRFISTGISVTTFRILGQDSINHTYYFDTLRSADTVSFDKFAIQLTPKKKFYLATSFHFKRSFSIFDEAFACSPPIPYSEEECHIEITCTKDFDQTHKIGDNLVDIFDVAIFDRYKNIIYYRMSLKDYMALRPNTVDELIFFLNKAPDKTDNYIFKIEYYRLLGVDEKLFIANSLDVVIPGGK